MEQILAKEKTINIVRKVLRMSPQAADDATLLTLLVWEEILSQKGWHCMEIIDAHMQHPLPSPEVILKSKRRIIHEDTDKAETTSTS